MQYSEYFLQHLGRFNLETFEKHPHAVYALDKDLAFCFFNSGWYTFSKENNGEPAITERFGLETPVRDAITPPLRKFYLNKYQEILNTNEVWHHIYECSSANIYRLYQQTVYPMISGSGLIIVNSLVVSEDFNQHNSGEKPSKPDKELFQDRHGFITQCSHCRRIQSMENRQVWVWVPQWVKKMPDNVSHSLCNVCLDYYYKN